MDDPVFLTCACLIIGSPPALTLAQITRKHAAKGSNLEHLISGTIFTSYIFFTTPVTIVLVFIALYINDVQDRLTVLALYPTLSLPTFFPVAT